MKKLFFLFSLLAITCGNAQITSNNQLFNQSILLELSKIPGWCSPKKAQAMMDLIFKVEPDVCVEIGVFAGSSLYPTACALKQINHGIVYGIDSWDTHECTKHYPDGDANKIWWNTIDMNQMFQHCTNLIQKRQLQNHCVLLKGTSENVAPEIQTIDILHIDGNHCDQSDLIHVLLYVPKVKIGGYIWFDGWSTSPEAFDYIKKTCYVEKVIDSGRCVLLRKVFADAADDCL